MYPHIRVTDGMVIGGWLCSPENNLLWSLSKSFSDPTMPCISSSIHILHLLPVYSKFILSSSVFRFTFTHIGSQHISKKFFYYFTCLSFISLCRSSALETNIVQYMLLDLNLFTMCRVWDQRTWPCQIVAMQSWRKCLISLFLICFVYSFNKYLLITRCSGEQGRYLVHILMEFTVCFTDHVRINGIIKQDSKIKRVGFVNK